ncbi:MAG: sigma-54 dependent transcriptional regulator [Saprospiraceae bacterium]|nr:sigma-54 dependent transcriptional regulator [Saprospiraceae bacterium]
MAKVLIVDDEASIRRTLRDILEYEKYEVDETKDGMECLVKLKKSSYDVVIMDIKMPKMDGMEALERIQLISPDTPVIMISGHANIDSAVEAVKKGAFDFIAKPPDLNRMLITIRNAMDRASLVSEKKVLQRRVSRSKTQEIIGESDSIAKIKKTIDQVAPTDARVLITGENGTGKELVARWIHEKSARNEHPIVEVNCAAIPAELIESELFGHEKGSFTSAVKQRIGKFEQANGGTLFLDEIGDMSLAAQAKVLRALQENRITRVGGEKSIAVNVRVIAATNKNLMDQIARKEFREDLYHRLAVIIVSVPALNDRRDDIPLLVKHFIEQICKEYGVPAKKITSDALKGLRELDWSGNIRELRNVVERLIILSGDSISKSDVLSFVVPNSRLQSRDKQLNFFDKFQDVNELTDFLNQAYSRYKSDVEV